MTEQKEQKIRRGDEMEETRWTSDPVCPYCGEEQFDAWELGLEGDGGTTEMDCGACDEMFTVVMHLAVTYSTFRDGENARGY